MNKSSRKKTAILHKGIQFNLYVMLFFMTVCLMGNTVFATEISSENLNTDNTTVTEQKTDTKKSSGKIVTEEGQEYFEKANGKKVKNKFVEVEGKTYYFGKKGVMEKGWMKKDGNYYYFDRNTGVQQSGTKVDGIKIRKNGQAQKSSYNKKKIETMIKAKSIVNKVTKATDTKEQKLKKMFDWVLKHPYKRYRILEVARKEKGWEMTFANDVYKKGNGCCVSEACALAFLAHECGYAKVYICDDTSHAWVEINGRVYDTLFAESKNYKKYYNATYKTAGLYRINKLKI